MLQLGFRVIGMDCAGCAAKIETALTRISGVSDVEIDFVGEKVSLKLSAESKTTFQTISRKIQTLGFDVEESHLPLSPTDLQSDLPCCGSGSTCCQKQLPEVSGAAAPLEVGQTGIPSPSLPKWWKTLKGRQVTRLAVLMGAAWSASYFISSQGDILFIGAVLLGVVPFFRRAVALALSGTPFSMETLMSLAAIGAVFIGEVEEAAAVIFLFSVGELLESVAAGKARAGIKALVSLVPKSAVLLDESGDLKIVPASALRVGDAVLVKPGDLVPADGTIEEGFSSLDESPVTGESIPRPKTSGDWVFAGSINNDGALRVRVGKVASDNTISRIIHLVEQAQAAKSPTARFIERFSRYYTPMVLIVATLVTVLPPITQGASWHTWAYRGLSLLLIACPCALVLSTPAAIASGLAVGTRRGLLIKGGNALETIGQARIIAFDKTGTITEGKPVVTDLIPFGEEDSSTVLSLAASVETGSGHPLAKAIVAYAKSENISIPLASASRTTAGKAVHATVNGRALALASPVHAQEMAEVPPPHLAVISSLQETGKTVSVLLDEHTRAPIGAIALRDEPRFEAQEGIAKLKALGLRCVMLTGDNSKTARAVAQQLDIEWKAELLPQDKLEEINALKQGSKVAMVGDGINDAPALAAADVGIAMGGGTDVALETADAALLKNRVTDMAHLVALSRATMNNIHQNVAFALGLKAVFFVTSILGITGLWIAVLADTGATALVTLNALRLLRFDPDKV